MLFRSSYLESEVARRTREVSAIQDVTIQAMASLAETRDSDTGNHIRRTQFYVKALTSKLRNHPNYSQYLTDTMIEMIFKSAPLHDIGKVGIPDRILLKPGRFDPAEFEIMKTHTTLGRDAIQAAENSLGLQVEFLSIAKEIAYGHQEKWDGSGYPEGLRGESIPVSARLSASALDTVVLPTPPGPQQITTRLVLSDSMSEFTVHRLGYGQHAVRGRGLPPCLPLRGLRQKQAP